MRTRPVPLDAFAPDERAAILAAIAARRAARLAAAANADPGRKEVADRPVDRPSRA
jgi:hypothetical protein